MSRQAKTIMETKHFLLEKPREAGISAVPAAVRREALAGYSRLLLSLARRDQTIRNPEKKKYQVSVCAIFKDEAKFLQEWLEYHLMVGVEHFYLYNNNSEDDFESVLRPYIAKGQVTLVDWKPLHAQMAAYQDAVGKFSGETRWMGFIDIDEFILPLKSDCIYDVLKPFDRRAGAVVIYWKYFGTSGIVQRDPDKLITEQFTASYPKLLDIGKCFYNTAFPFGGDIEGKNNVLHHVLWCRWKNRWLPPVNVQGRVSFMNRNRLSGRLVSVQLNHYVTKGKEDYIRKMNMATDVFFKKNPRTLGQFEAIEARCTGKDEQILRFLPELKRRTAKDRTSP